MKHRTVRPLAWLVAIALGLSPLVMIAAELGNTALAAKAASPAKTVRLAKNAKRATSDSKTSPLTSAVPATTAAELDRLLNSEVPINAGANEKSLAGAATKPASQIDDRTFLRRVAFDLTGRAPTPTEINAFVKDSSPDKRSKLVERLLADSQFGENWGHYWRDVILYRRSDDRALLVGQTMNAYLVEAFNKNTPWDSIAKAFITATGDVREEGATGIFMAQMGETSDITAEVSRVFMGIQIACAQCHNHPTDRWNREQFHELAAFFPRIAVRPKNDGEKRSYEVVSRDRAAFGGKGNGRPRGNPEHYMPDLNNPTDRGTKMEPVFFVTGQKLEPGKTDIERRETIARWITATENPWFAKAFVNRIWSELVGEGFYEPVDDLGPDRQPTAPKTLDYLAAQFAANKYDIKWLFRTVTATEAYQRAGRSRRNPDETPFVANAVQRLRGDQLYSAITSVLGTSNLTQAGRGGKGYQNLRDPRFVFNLVFGFDPSTRRDEISGSIPQALALMNSPLIAAGMSGSRSSSMLGKLLADEKNDKAVANELYLRTLSREPKPTELTTCLSHVKRTGDRTEGFEDILWALLNSAEFAHRK